MKEIFSVHQEHMPAKEIGSFRIAHAKASRTPKIASSPLRMRLTLTTFCALRALFFGNCVHMQRVFALFQGGFVMRSWLKPRRAELKKWRLPGLCRWLLWRRRECDVGGILATAISNTGRHCTRFGNDHRQLDACDARTFLGEGTVCEGQDTRHLLRRKRRVHDRTIARVAFSR